MKHNGRKVFLSGMMAVAMTVSFLPEHVVFADKMVEETGALTAEIQTADQEEAQKEYPDGLEAQDRSVYTGSQAAEWIQKNRQASGEENIGEQEGTNGRSLSGSFRGAQYGTSRNALQENVTGECGENVNFRINMDTGEVVISGSGAMADYKVATDSPFYPYGDFITSVTIEEGVTSVGALSFAFCFGIEEVELPDTVTAIGAQAFLGCVSLELLIVPQGVTSIGDYALGYYCSNGKEGTYDKTGLNIAGITGSAADTYATEKEINFVASDTVSHDCGEGLTWSLDLETGTLEISGSGPMADYKASVYYNVKPSYYPYRFCITSIVVGEGVTSIGEAAFCEFEKLASVQLADSVTSIGESAFSGCGSLQEIPLSSGIKTIGASAFSDCYMLKEITIPQSVTSIGGGVFTGCNRLEKIQVEEGNTSYTSENGALYTTEKSSLIAFPQGYPDSGYIVPETLRSLAGLAFSGTKALKYLVFQGNAPSSLSSRQQRLEGITIFYNATKTNWESTVANMTGVSWVDMSEMLDKETLSISAETQQLNVGESIQLSAQINPVLAAEFKWSSSDENVAVVSRMGKLTALNPGSTEIWVTSEDGKYTDKLTVTVVGDAFSMPAHETLSLEGCLNYTSVYETTKQIVCEELHGIYFLSGKELGFYSLASKSFQPVETFAGCADAYAANGKLYILYNNTCYIYDLFTQSMLSKFNICGYQTSVIGADGNGRVYVGGNSRYHLNKNVILLFSDTGELIDELPIGTSVYAFSGFDSTNGNFYMESFYDYYSWGYSHPGKGLTMGRLEGEQLRYIDTYYSFLESGMISRGMSCIEYLCQNSYMYHQTSAELIGGKYLVATSALHGSVSAYDSNTAGKEGIDMLMGISRPAAEDGETTSYTDISSIGVRAVYHEENDSMIVYENNKTISEYALNTGKKIADGKTEHNVFNMLKMGDFLLAIEKENDAYYLEAVDWGIPSQFRIHAENTEMAVGTCQTLSLESEKDYTLLAQWLSSDESVVTVTQEGKVSAWKAGTAELTAKISDSLSAKITVTVVEENAVIPEENVVTKQETGSDNASDNNYERYGKTVKSYLVENEDKTLTRVEYLGEEGIAVKTYSADYELKESKTLQCELGIFGGFYSGKDANFFVFGQRNDAESDENEVLRIVKYSKTWQRQEEASVKGANTYIPFEAGSLRMAETAGQLYIYTCHEMYAGEDGLHHQANMTFVLNEETMEVIDSFYSVLNIAQAGYVSHSFNQFIQTDGSSVFRVDHGDANPRAVSLTKCGVGEDIKKISYQLPLPINGYSGDNSTGVSVGGFELSSDNCLIAGNSVDQSDADTYSAYGQRNIFLAIMSKQLNSRNIIWLTNYDGSENITPRTPYLVKLSEEQFLVMWEEYNSESKRTTVKMLTVDAEGKRTSEVKEAAFRLSDCAPIVTSERLVKWYATTGDSIDFYAIHPYYLSSVKSDVETEEPSEGDESSETEKPSEGDKSSETEEPSEGDKSSETEKPSEGDESSETEKPSEGDESSETGKPSEGDKSSETEKPSEGDESSEAEKPSEGDKSSETEKPSEGEKPSETEKPSEGDESSEIEKPSEGDKSSETEKPSEGGTSSETEKSSEAEKPSGTELSSESGKPASSVTYVKTISISGDIKKLAAGCKLQLQAAVLPNDASNKTVVWKSSNERYAIVNSETGLVTAKKTKKIRTVKITAEATDGSGVKQSYKLKIMPKAVKKIKLTVSSNTVKAGKRVRIKAIVSPKKLVNKKLIYISSAPKYATVTSKGIVKTKKAGKGKTVKITVMATDGSGKKKSIKIHMK